MSNNNDSNRRIYVGTHDGVCALNTDDGGLTWKQGKITPLANAAARLSVSPLQPDRAYLAAYEAGVFKTDDGGNTWNKLPAYPTGYAHSVLAHPKVEVRWNTSVDAVLGEGEVVGVSVTDLTSGETSRIDLSGVFIFVGLEPNSQYLADLLPLDNAGHVPTDIWMRTPLPGLLAAGDIRQSSAAQLVTSAGDGATAAIAAQRYVETGEWPG